MANFYGYSFKVNGTARTAKVLYHKVNGTAKTAVQDYIIVNGTAKMTSCYSYNTCSCNSECDCVSECGCVSGDDPTFCGCAGYCPDYCNLCECQDNGPGCYQY